MTVPAGARIEPGTAGDDGVAAVEWSTVEAPLATVTAGTGSTIVFVHGFTQTGQSWRPIAEHFVRHHHRCVLVDLPGHGGSTDVRADLPSSASLVAASVASVATTATFVGYSLGSRVCLHLAVAHAQFVERLVLVGAHPGLEDDADRADRRAADERLAERVLAIGVPAFLGEWVSQPLFGTYRPGADEVADRQRNTADGLASSLRSSGTGTQVPLWSRLANLTMPVLVMAGRDDTKFVALARRVAADVPGSQLVLVDRAAHAAHLEQPAVVTRAIETFIAGG